MNDKTPLKFSLYESIATSACGTGTLKRDAETTYSLFSVRNGDAWLPDEFGISMISLVSNVVRSIRAIRGVLFALMNNHRPSVSPFVCESCGWCESSQGIDPYDVINIGFVSSLNPYAFSGLTENTGTIFRRRPDGRP